MFKKGMTIVYGSVLCTITDKKQITIGKTPREYYVLTPFFDEKNVIYVPTDNDTLLAKMQNILSKQQIHNLLKNMPDSGIQWIDDDRVRTQEYKEIINSGNREQIFLVTKTLALRKQELESKKRKLHAADEALLSRAEKFICEEFAVVLDIKREDVIPYIISHTQQ